MNFFLLSRLFIMRQLKMYKDARLRTIEKINEETLVKGIAIMLLLTIGKNQNSIVKGMASKIIFLFGDKYSFNVINCN